MFFINCLSSIINAFSGVFSDNLKSNSFSRDYENLQNDWRNIAIDFRIANEEFSRKYSD